MRPEFLTNREGERVADALKGYLQHLLALWNTPFELGIATAYFNPEGYNLLANELQEVGHVRLLLGAEPISLERRVRHLDPDTPPERADRTQLRNALTGHRRSIEEDRDLLGFEIEADRAARRLIEWLRSGNVEVKRLERRFLHGKAFIVTTHDEGAIAGSSNFTFAGLTTNLELNLGQFQPNVVSRVRDWFDELWDEAEPFDLAAIYDARYQPHNPYIIYLRMLYERYGAEIEQEAKDEGLAGIHLTNFQRDGVWRAHRILDSYGGVLIADGVGLGKSFIAGELMREAVQERRQRVLLVAPASLRDGPWRHFLAEHQLGIEVVSFEELSQDRQLNPEGTGAALRFNFNEYAMVVIDEAHAYRNPSTVRSTVLRTLLSGRPAKDLVLLTATPVNNSLWDLYYLVNYFVRNDAAFAGHGIRSLRDHFAEAAAESADELSPERLFDILDAVAVRRTRHFVKRYYPRETVFSGGIEVPITFAQPTVKKASYDLEEVLPGFFPRLAHALAHEDHEHAGTSAGDAEHPVLTLARYAPSRYLRDDAPETYELQLAGLLRSGLLKRFESSAYAFAKTCRKMAQSHDAFLQILDRGYIATGETINEWVATDSDEVEDLLRDGRQMQPSGLYDVTRLKRDVLHDRDLLLRFAADAEAVRRNDDPKLAELVSHLAEIATEAREEAFGEDDERDRRKVVIFTYYADTVDWIAEHLRDACRTEPQLTAYQDRIVTISGQAGDRAEALYGFAPKSSNAPPGSDTDRFDILISTDVLAEGVNLQQARHIINFDLPWNPMRLVQRHGRIDRIGSKHDRVYLRCFFPDQQLNELLGLQERLHRKIAQAAASIGVEAEVLPGSRVTDLTYAETRDEIEQLRRESPELFEKGGETGSAYSGEEYRQELREAMQHPDLRRQILSLPWGAGSGMACIGARRGFVFCARVGDHPNAIFRFVAYDEEAPDIVDDTLVCLSQAHATAETERVVSEEMHQLAYDAWAVTRREIYESWLLATDPRNLEPEVPKAMREAAALLREYRPLGIPDDEYYRVLDSIEAPYGARILKVIRDAMRSSENPRESARAVIAAVEQLGLEPAEPPKPLPVISEDDVNLVCWMAVVPPSADDR